MQIDLVKTRAAYSLQQMKQTSHDSCASKTAEPTWTK